MGNTFRNPEDAGDNRSRRCRLSGLPAGRHWGDASPKREAL